VFVIPNKSTTVVSRSLPFLRFKKKFCHAKKSSISFPIRLLSFMQHTESFHSSFFIFSLHFRRCHVMITNLLLFVMHSLAKIAFAALKCIFSHLARREERKHFIFPGLLILYAF